tara:strand:+ start:162 stop:1679 length:1518 start_codon:yes stop_codon:yes gene_type:complete
MASYGFVDKQGNAFNTGGATLEEAIQNAIQSYPALSTGGTFRIDNNDTNEKITYDFNPLNYQKGMSSGVGHASAFSQSTIPAPAPAPVSQPMAPPQQVAQQMAPPPNLYVDPPMTPPPAPAPMAPPLAPTPMAPPAPMAPITTPMAPITTPMATSVAAPTPAPVAAPMATPRPQGQPMAPNKGGVAGVLPQMGATPMAPNKGGVAGSQPVASPQANPPQYQPMPSPTSPLAPTAGFNVNQASAGALEQAMMGAQTGMGFQPQDLSAVGYTPAQQVAQQVAGADLSPYTNPYETQVVNQALADISGQQERALNQMGAQATAARAFGGSRQGVEAAETRKAYDEQAARTAATLRQGGFDRAIGAAQFDVGQRASAEAANVAARTGASQFGAQSMMDAQRQNVANRMAAESMRQGAGARLGGYGQQAFNIGRSIQQDQANQGLLQQGIQQALIDAAKGQYAGYTGAPMAALGAPLAALGSTPSQSTTTENYNPGLFSYLQSFAQLPKL